MAQAALALVLAVAALLVDSRTSAAAGPGTFMPTGSLTFARAAHRATLLLDGRVLVSGGQTNTIAIGAAEVYTPATGTWAVTGSNLTARYGHSAALLQDGRVLVTGGVGSNDCTSSTSAELYDPATGTWAATGSLPAAVGTGHILVRLEDGRVLAAGGGNRCGGVFATAALYTPATGTWAATGNMTTAREFHSAVLLPDGRVLVAGGIGSNPFPSLASAEIYDPATGTWTPDGTMPTPRATHCGEVSGSYLAPLPGGKVLAAAGARPTNCFTPSVPGPTNAADVFSTGSLTWAMTDPMGTARAFTDLTALANGRVLVAGGSDGTNTLATAELYNPTTGTWAATGSLTAPRAGHTATRLANGNVLIAAGSGNAGNLASAELYAPVPVAADLAAGMTESMDPAVAGVDLTYTVTAMNTGPDAATGVTMIDTLPRGLSFVSAAPSQGTCSTALVGGRTRVTCALGTLAAGASATVAIVARPTAAGLFTNVAIVRASGPADPNPSNSLGVSVVTVTGPATAAAEPAALPRWLADVEPDLLPERGR
jgi:uncharacterized repeat protein (TIGR01451 family)